MNLKEELQNLINQKNDTHAKYYKLVGAIEAIEMVIKEQESSENNNKGKIKKEGK